MDLSNRPVYTVRFILCDSHCNIMHYICYSESDDTDNYHINCDLSLENQSHMNYHA